MANAVKLLLYLSPLEIAPRTGQAQDIVTCVGRKGGVGRFLVREVANHVAIVLAEKNTNKRVVGWN